ncbi:MAG: NUDIX domain-containing protein [Alphaproteobacteria bacterium]|nr:NUDIX domain-containing protein [Alphaproteobacteria bacterium]MBV9061998.1 NUDIX domain-containing protein [Alphaproteobacteria bacterium]
MEKALEGFEKDEVFVKNRLRPRDAATLVLVRRDADGPRVLMGRRHGNMTFMANKYVFPGGRVDPCDGRVKLGGDFKPHVYARLLREVSERRARALALAAVRETFEETGILIGERSKNVPRARSAWSRFFAHGVVPKLHQLDYIARAITPPNRPRRFDARFFMAEATAIARELDAPDTDELLTPCWLNFAEARAIDIPAITRAVLAEIEARVLSTDKCRPVPFFRFLRGKSQLEYL